MLRDPRDYPEPESFYPDRFIKNGKINREVRDPSTITFGFGRRSVQVGSLSSDINTSLTTMQRICPGRHLAKDMAFLLMASVLHVFDILPLLDENGDELDPTPHMTCVGVLSLVSASC